MVNKGLTFRGFEGTHGKTLAVTQHYTICLGSEVIWIGGRVCI